MTSEKQVILGRVRQAIANTGMDGMAFAKRADISYATLREYARGECLPGAAVLRKICVAAGVSADWLLFGDEGSPASRPSEINEVR